jgi:hypothetical protein
MPPEINPRLVFERLYGSLETSLDPKAQAALDEDRLSILDYANERTRKLVGTLGASDRRKIDEYLTAIREIEKRIVRAENDNRQLMPEIDKPNGVPANFADHVRLFHDLLVVAFQADITRISTFMMAREVSYRTFPMLGISEAFHPASHHQNNPDRLTQLTKIQTFHVGLWSYWLEKLRSTPDGEGNLLDHSLLLYGGAMSNSNVHNHSPLPIVVAGGANGAIKGGRHLLYPENTPMANLLLTILQKAGIPQDSVGDSTGPLSEL